MPATREVHMTGIEQVLYVGIDLGLESWQVAMTVGFAQLPQPSENIAGVENSLAFPAVDFRRNSLNGG